MLCHIIMKTGGKAHNFFMNLIPLFVTQKPPWLRFHTWYVCRKRALCKVHFIAPFSCRTTLWHTLVMHGTFSTLTLTTMMMYRSTRGENDSQSLILRFCPTFFDLLQLCQTFPRLCFTTQFTLWKQFQSSTKFLEEQKRLTEALFNWCLLLLGS